MLEDVDIVNFLDLHIAMAIQKHFVCFNLHILAQWVRLEVRSEREVRHDTLDGSQFCRFHFQHIFVLR